MADLSTDRAAVGGVGVERLTHEGARRAMGSGDRRLWLSCASARLEQRVRRNGPLAIRDMRRVL